METFHFSPRPNRAHEIEWQPWGPEAFERAREADKPVLLAISAVWCHWCHVMDETSYSNPAVIAAINERFVPVRVDNDRRPDVNARYNMGGWPTTAFLAPDGTAITGSTYMPPAQMLRALDEITQFYAANKDKIAERAAQLRDKRASYKPASHEDLRESMIVRLVEELTEAFDDQYGGFGDEPKFPQPEMLEFLFTEWRATGEQRLYDMVARTMLGMSRGGMYDHVEGGFFRYSTTRDWSVPHFEKMSEDHAGLLRVLARLVLATGAADFRTTLVSAIGYVRAVLRDPATGLFAGSQDADEEYFALPLDERRQREAPYVDRTVYANWTCGLASAWALAARALDDDDLAREACETLDAVHERFESDGLLLHFAIPGEAPQVRGLLTDQVAYVRALLDAHELSGEARFLQRARDVADRTIERFGPPDGGFYDRYDAEATLGRLDVADRPIGDNGLLAESLLRLHAMTGDERYRAAAEGTLALFARTFAAAQAFASTYARALRRYLSPETVVRIVGNPGDTEEFREAAARLPSPFTVVRTIPPADAAAFGLPAEPAPVAYTCAGTSCSAPARNASELHG